MSKLSKALQAVAGNAASEILPEAIDFDGTNDYLSRSSDLTGNTDSKTFTFSAWIYLNTDNPRLYHNGYVSIGVDTSERLYGNMYAADASGDAINFICPTGSITLNTWVHILISADASNASNRSVYINDQAVSVTWSAYNNKSIGFSRPAHGVAATSGGSSKLWGRLSSLFLDYTYRDLSVTNNRRLFITEDLKPADGLADLSPIIYLPLNDPEDIGNNTGTGGDFTVNGVMARSQRGPNQDNCLMSYMQTSSDYITISQSTTTYNAITIAFTTSINTGSYWKAYPNNGADPFLDIGPTSVKLQISQFSPSYVNKGTVYVNYDGLALGGVRGVAHVVITVNVTTGAYQTSINGNVQTGTVSLSAGNAQWGNLRLVTPSNTPWFAGEFYLDHVFTDLATDNPFWNSETQRPKSVRLVIEETGVTPLIALPFDAGDAGKNIGTLADFSVSSGPYIGARGASEYWSKSMNKLTWVNNSTLSVSTKTFSFVFAVKPPDTTARHAINFTNGKLDLCIPSTTTETIFYAAGSTSLNIRHNLYMGSALNWFIYFISIDMDDQSKTRWYVKPLDSYYTLTPSLTFSSFSTGNAVTFENFAVNMQSGYSNNYEMSSVYFTTSYIDFSQEAERLKFADAFGYPLNIEKQIEDGIVPTPTFYLPFDTPSNFGRNLGSGGDFTVNGTNKYNGSDVSKQP